LIPPDRLIKGESTDHQAEFPLQVLVGDLTRLAQWPKCEGKECGGDLSIAWLGRDNDGETAGAEFQCSRCGKEGQSATWSIESGDGDAEGATEEDLSEAESGESEQQSMDDGSEGDTKTAAAKSTDGIQGLLDASSWCSVTQARSRSFLRELHHIMHPAIRPR
jgi:hypothetical protein